MQQAIARVIQDSSSKHKSASRWPETCLVSLADGSVCPDLKCVRWRVRTWPRTYSKVQEEPGRPRFRSGTNVSGSLPTIRANPIPFRGAPLSCVLGTWRSFFDGCEPHSNLKGRLRPHGFILVNRSSLTDLRGQDARTCNSICCQRGLMCAKQTLPLNNRRVDGC
jgi:hypothetical protein